MAGQLWMRERTPNWTQLEEEDEEEDMEEDGWGNWV